MPMRNEGFSSARGHLVAHSGMSCGSKLFDSGNQRNRIQILR